MTATAVDAALRARPPGRAGAADLPHAPRLHASLYQPGHMRRRLDQLIETNRRYGHPFGLVVFDVDGPGDARRRRGGGQETVLAVVGAALRDSVRIVDEAFRLEEDALCVLAPNLPTVEGVQMAERLLRPARGAGGGGGAADRDLGRRRRLSRARQRRRAAAAQGRRGDVAGPCGGPAGGRRRSCKIADRFRKSVHNLRKPGFRWENAVPANSPRPPDARNTNQRRRRSARRQPQHPAQLGAPLRLPDAEAHRRQPPQLRAGRAADPARRARPDRQHLLGDRAGPPAPVGAGQRRRHCWPRWRASTRTPPTARSRRAWRCARWSARSRSCCCRRSTSSPPTPTARPSSSSPRAGRPAGCTAPAASPPPPRARPASCCSTRAAARRRGGPRPGARPDPAPRRLPRPDALQRARRRAARARPAAPSTRPRSSSAAPAPTPSAVKLVRKIRELGFDAPLYGFRASGLIGDAVPSAGEQPQPGHGDAQRRPAPPRRPGFRLDA